MSILILISPNAIIFYVFSMPNIGIHVLYHGSGQRHVLNQQRDAPNSSAFENENVFFQLRMLTVLWYCTLKASMGQTYLRFFVPQKSTNDQRSTTYSARAYYIEMPNPLALYIQTNSVPAVPKTQRTTKCINEFMAYKMLSVLIDDNF